jgi:hypothetical protein
MNASQSSALNVTCFGHTAVDPGYDEMYTTECERCWLTAGVRTAPVTRTEVGDAV